MYIYFDLQAFEEELCNNKIKPLLSTQEHCYTLPKYFRFINKIDYTNLSAASREYILQYFTKEIDIEQNWNKEKSIGIYQEIIRNIQSKPEGYTKYGYDGHSIENDDPIAHSYCFAENDALNNRITFGIYYVQFDEDIDSDEEFRNHNIAARIARSLKASNLEAVMFSEVDLLRMVAVNL